MYDIKLDNIFDIILRNLPMTKQMLIYYGYTEEQINKLIEENILIQINNSNEYKLYSNYELYYYGLRELSRRQFLTANSCFIKCASLEPNNRDFALQIFLKYIKYEEYDKAFNQFAILEKIEPEENKEENNIYLYLLSILTSCKEEYQERLENLEYDSLLLKPDSKVHNKDRINLASKFILKTKYRKALETLTNVIKHDEYSEVRLEVLKELLTKVVTYEKSNKLSLLAFAKDKRYQSIESTLKTKSKTIYLNNMETYIYLVASALTKLKYDGVIPTVTIQNTNHIYEAIKGNNFELAQELNRVFMKQNSSPLDNQILDVLLTDINKLISRIKSEQSEENRENIPEKNYLKEIEELANYYLANNIQLEDAQVKYNLSEEQVLLIKLMYARNYYIEEMYLLGDLLLKEVTKSKNKTTIVVNFLNEVTVNKKFYKNRKTKYTRKKAIY